MATRLYLRATQPATEDKAGSGESSTALPVGTANGTSPTNYNLSLNIGTGQTSWSLNTLAQTAQQSGTVSKWSSNRLVAQTIFANTWTFFFGATESNAAANMFTSLSVYVWSSSGGGFVRGYIYDNAATLGTEWATSQSAQSVTFSGSQVAAQEDDLLVIEWWYNATQGMGTAYTGTGYFDGTNDTTTGTGNTNTATYLETPQDLILKVPKSNFIFIM